jgi:hypothetical protein
MFFSLEFTEINRFIFKMRRSVNRSSYGVHIRTTEEQTERENVRAFHIWKCNTIKQVWRKKAVGKCDAFSFNVIRCVTFRAESCTS